MLRTFPDTSYVTDYANLGGTGDRSGIITLSYTYQSGVDSPHGLVDGSQTATFKLVANQLDGYWLFDFGVGVFKYIDEITWYQDVAGTHGTQIFEGSNDGTVWDDIADFIVLGITPTSVVKLQPYTTNAYRMFRLRQFSGVTNGTPVIREVEFKIADSHSGIPVPDVDFNTKNTVTFTIDENEFGDGYDQRSASGINNTRDSWAASWTNITTREKTTIEGFIREQKGFAAFHWQAPASDPSFRYSARDLNIQPVDAGYWIITSTIRQEFDL